MSEISAPLTLSRQSPLPQRLIAWMHERFPLANTVFFFSIYLCTAAVAKLGVENGTVSFSWTDLVACFMTWTVFLLLRVFDEHKDYALDVKNHPERVLQSGLITLTHLKVLAGVAVGLQISWSVFVDGGVRSASAAWLIMFAWICLMGKEFFCGERLEKRLTLYAFSHMLVMPLIVWWQANIANPEVVFSKPLIAVMTLSFFSGFCFEITRKTRGPEEERETVDSYSKIFGTTGAALLVSALVVLMIANQFYIAHMLVSDSFLIGYAALAVALTAALWQLAQFIRSPSEKGRKKNEAVVALTTVVGYVVVISAVLSEFGSTFQIA